MDQEQNISGTLNYSSVVNLLRFILNSDLPADIDRSRNRIDVYSEKGDALGWLHVPVFWALSENRQESTKYIDTWQEQSPPYLMFLIQAGYAAVGTFENGVCERHKSIRRYMVRKKQGKAQISYLKTKGKSRAGSRIRLAESRAFFQDINECLNEWWEANWWHGVLFSCTPVLWGELFAAEPEPPFGKKEPRLKKVPFDVGRPGYEELIKMNDLLHQGRYRFSAEIPAELLSRLRSYSD